MEHREITPIPHTNACNLTGGDNEFHLNTEYVMLTDRKIGSGSFGNIYVCVNTKTKQMFAVKIESNNGKPSQLFQESRVIQELRSEKGFPTVFSVGLIGQEKYMVMDLLGENLDSIMLKTKSRKFSMKTSLLIADQMLSRLQFLHTKGIIHRDLKPENILIGSPPKEKTLYLIDYGLSKHIFKPKTCEHIPYRDKKEILGTLRYVSINTHKGIEQSRRDDLESLGYILIYFIKGELPWQGIRAKTQKEKVEKLFHKKCETVPDELCKFFPEEIKLYFDHVLNLQFTSVPNYFLIQSYIKNLMTKYGCYNDLVFDWENKELMAEPNSCNVINDMNSNGVFKANVNKSTSCDSLQAKDEIGEEQEVKIKHCQTNSNVNGKKSNANESPPKRKVDSTKLIQKISQWDASFKRRKETK